MLVAASRSVSEASVVPRLDQHHEEQALHMLISEARGC